MIRSSGGCTCLNEIRNGLPRTKFCFMPCSAQRAMMEEERNIERVRENEKLKSIIRHIKKVEDNCNALAQQLMEKRNEDTFARQLIQRGRLHDASKFDEFEFNHLNDQTSQSLFQEALTTHHSKNSHHPEFWSGGIHEMTRLDIAEMVCDCLARSQEFGTDIRHWFFVEAPEKYKYDKTSAVWHHIDIFLFLLLTPPFKKPTI